MRKLSSHTHKRYSYQENAEVSFYFMQNDYHQKLKNKSKENAKNESFHTMVG